MHEAEREWARHAARAADLTIEAHGVHRIDPAEQYVVAPLHEGFADVIALSRLPLDLAYSVAEELFDWSLLGRYLTASDQCPVPVRNRAAAYRSIVRAAEASFCRNESYVMFPQARSLASKPRSTRCVPAVGAKRKGTSARGTHGRCFRMGVPVLDESQLRTDDPHGSPRAGRLE